MSAAVAQLPAPRAPTHLVELERKLIGGALHLAPGTSVFEALALVGGDLSVELWARSWNACRRQAEAGIKYSVETVTSAGLKKGAITVEQARELEQLAGVNTLTLEQWRQLAQDYKRLRVGLSTAGALEAEAARIRRGEFDEATTAGRLSALERELHRGAARIEDLTGDQDRLLERWDSNRRENRQDLVPTGIKVLDDVIGGLPHRLCLFAADAGVGKTALLDSMLHSMLLVNPTLQIGLISPEDGVEHVAKRWLARETGWVLRDIGNRALPEREDEEKLQVAAAKNHPLLKRVHGYRERSVTGDQLIALCWQLAELGCGVIGIDNFNKISLRGREDYHERVQRFSDRLSEFAEKARVAVPLLVHLADTETHQRGKQVSGSGGLQGGKALGRDARFRLDLFRKEGELRGLIAKANELGEQGTVIQFARQATAGLIDPDKGFPVDLNVERAMERRRKTEDQEAERERLAKKRRDKRAAEKAEELAKAAAAAPPPQATLIDVPPTEKPDAKPE